MFSLDSRTVDIVKRMLGFVSDELILQVTQISVEDLVKIKTNTYTIKEDQQ